MVINLVTHRVCSLTLHTSHTSPPYFPTVIDIVADVIETALQQSPTSSIHDMIDVIHRHTRVGMLVHQIPGHCTFDINKPTTSDVTTVECIYSYVLVEQAHIMFDINHKAKSTLTLQDITF